MKYVNKTLFLMSLCQFMDTFMVENLFQNERNFKINKFYCTWLVRTVVIVRDFHKKKQIL